MLNGLSYSIVAVYGLVVLYRGNLDKLFTLLKGEGRFLEIVIAYALLAQMGQSDRVGPVARGLMTMAGIALLIKIVANPNIAAVLSAYNSGQTLGQSLKAATSAVQ